MTIIKKCLVNKQTANKENVSINSLHCYRVWMSFDTFFWWVTLYAHSWVSSKMASKRRWLF